MKSGLYIAFVCLAMFSVHAQNAASHDCHVSDNASDAVEQDYAVRVNGLLRDIHATLQAISERAEAEALTAQQAQSLKLAATRAMIAHLETLSAVYDSKIASARSTRDRRPSESGVSHGTTTQGVRRRLTVSVRELEGTTSAPPTAGQ